MLRQLPNLLSAFRLVMVPVLLGLAWNEQRVAFLFAFAAALASDVADGFVARRTGATSELGAKLDSWGDLASYLVLPISAWWLWPERILAQLALVAIALVAFLAPTLVGLLKFRRLTSYHTRAAKLSAIVMGAGLLLYLGAGVAWLFQVAVLLLVIEAIEEIAITTVLPAWRANVPSIFAALRISRAGAVFASLALGLALGAAPASAQALPDLVPEVSDIDLYFDTTVPEGDVVEGCASATSGVDLLRLALTTRNAGPADVELGDPMCPDCATHPNEVCGDPSFICSPAGGHNHPHYQNFMRYELIDPNGVQVGLGGKRSFCLFESGCDAPGPNQNHTCTNQGLGAGCWDVYPSYLGCQYVEITGIPEGSYTLRVTIDPGNEFVEADESNNVLEQPVVIVRGGEPDVSLAGQALAIRPGKLLRLRARPMDSDPLPGLTGDPTLGGALLHVVDTHEGSDLELALPASGWRAIGRDGARGYRYRGAGTEADPCTSVVLKKGKLHVKCKGSAIEFGLPAEGEIFVQLDLGAAGKRYCAAFGGKSVKNATDSLKRRNAPPSTCSVAH